MAFEIKVSGSEENTTVGLTDKSSDTRVEVFAFGAVLNEFSIKLVSGRLNVIEGFSSTANAMAKITDAFKSAKLSPFACRLNNEKYHFADTAFHVKKFSLGKHAIHGLLYDAVFSVVETIANDDFASVQLQYAYNNEIEGYPFSYRCEVLYKLEAGNKLSLSTTITNLDGQLIPISDGWHPYFTLGNSIDDCQLEFQSNEMVEFDEGLIPTGKLSRYEEFGSLSAINDVQLDNCFTLNFAECQPLCVFRNPARKVQVEFYPTKSYPYIQIYTPTHRKSIAIENLSAAPDAFNNAMGLDILEPGESKIFSTSYVVKSLE